MIEIPASVEKIEPFPISGDIKEMISRAKAPFGILVFSGECRIKKLTVPKGTEISDMAFGMTDVARQKLAKLQICYL